jgi:glutamine amidotransferase
VANVTGVVVIDYGAGNLRSVTNALAHLGVPHDVTDDPEVVARAAKVIFPGVGAAAACMAALRARGLVDALRACGAPLLGICLGMQVLAELSEEGEPPVACLGLVPGRVERFPGGLKVPQIGWNTVRVLDEGDPLFHGIPQDEPFYFLHGYRLRTDPAYVLAETTYGEPYPSAVRRGTVRGVQFHPEKSGPAGLRLLRNFVERC